MGSIPNVRAIVEKNGTSVRFKSASIRWEANKIAPSWDVTFPEMVSVSSDDTWTIKTGFAGGLWTKVDDCTVSSLSGEDGVHTSTTSISGAAENQTINDLREYCIPKTLCFISPDWLADIEPSARVIDGTVKYGSTNPAQCVRLFHPRLPGKEFNEGTFQCILGPTTHHAIVRYLASLIGYRVIVNTPDVTLQDTMTISSGTKWGDAVTSMFAMWGPQISILPSADGTPVIYIADVINDGAEVPGVQIIRIDDPAIVSTSFTDEAKSEIVDHLIVTGRKTKNSTVIYEEPPNFTPVEVPVVDLATDKWVDINLNIAAKEKVQGRGNYDGTFGLPDTPEYRTPLKVVRQVQRIGYHIYRDADRNEKYIPMEEQTLFYDAYGIVVGKTVIKHYYSKALKPVRTIEEDYAYCNMPGSSDKGLHLLRVKATYNDQFVKPLNQSSTVEIINDTILFEWAKHKDGRKYRVNPRPMLDLVRQDYSKSVISTDEKTAQDTLQMTSHERKTEIFRTHDDVLIKRDYDFDRLSDAFKSTSQVLENPNRDKPKTTKKDNTFRVEFFDGPGKMIGGYGPCYHPPKTVNHDDICDVATAQKIANRVFARKNLGQNLSVTVKTPVPIPFLGMTTIIRLGAFTRTINGEEITVPEADYVLRGITENISYEGAGNTQELKYEQTLSLRTRF